MENAGKIVARDDIIARLWESDEFIDDNTLTVNVARLRKKLENADMEGRIKTKKGIGYYLDKLEERKRNDQRKYFFIFENPQNANYYIYRNRCDIWNTILFI